MGSIGVAGFRVSAVALSMISGCFTDLAVPSETQIRCTQDADCPPGFSCRQSVDLCFDETLIDLVICGDGIVDVGEICDDGNTMSGDGCSSDCQSDESCGNGITDSLAGEQCDCGSIQTDPFPPGCSLENSRSASATCRPDCSRPGCGDGVVVPPEECEGSDLRGAACTDLAFYSGTLSCSAFCRFDVSECSGQCGDGMRQGQEQCDETDLNGQTCLDFGFYAAAGLACNAVCGFDASECTLFCGDGIVNGFELCDSSRPTLSCADLDLGSGRTECSGACAPTLEGCRPIGWQQEPALTSSDLNAVYGTETNVFVAGDTFAGQSNVLRYDGTQWTTLGAIELDVHDLWGTLDDLWAVGAGTGTSDVFRYDGSTWTAVASAPVGPWRGVWGTTNGAAEAEVWLVGANTVAHYDGTWSTTTLSGVSTDIWGSGPNDIYAVGSQIWRYDGTWNDITSLVPPGLEANAVLGLSRDEVWIAGETDIIGRTGATWTSLNSPRGEEPDLALASGQLFASNVSENESVFFLNAVWQPVLSAGPISALWARDLRSVWAAGERGVIYRFRGQYWHPDTEGALGGTRLESVWGTGPERIFASGGSSGLQLFEAGRWTALPGVPDDFAVDGVFGFEGGPTYVYGRTAVAGGRIFEKRGDVYTEMTIDNLGPAITTIHGATADRVFAANSNGRIFERSDATTCGDDWCEMPLNDDPQNTRAIHAFSDLSAIAVGADCSVRWFDGSWGDRQTLCVGSSPLLFDVWGTSETNVVTVGQFGTALRFDGTSWSAIELGTRGLLSSVDGTSEGDIFIVGDGFMSRFDGVAWGAVTPPASGAIYRGVFVSGPRVVAVGDVSATDVIHILERPAFQKCAPNRMLDCGATVTGTLLGGETDFAQHSCASSTSLGAERYYRLSRPTPGTITANVASEFGPIAAIYEARSGICALDSCLTSVETTGDGVSLTVDASAGADYILALDAKSGDREGAFELTITCE